MVAVINHPTARFGARLWRLITLRRVPGLAAEAAFWLVFSLPWLLLGAVNVIGLLDRFLPADTLDRAQQELLTAANDTLSPELVAEYVQPVVDGVFSDGSAGISVLSLVVALWSGSRSVQTFIESNLIINGEFRTWGYIKVRLLSMAMLVGIVIIAGVLVPASSIGPAQVGQWWGWPAWLVAVLTQVLTVGLLLALLAAVMTYSLPDPPPLWRALPGALFTVVGWWVGSAFLGFYVRRLFDDGSIYGVLAAPIAILVYAYAVALLAFIGEAINAALRGLDVARPQRGAKAGPAVSPAVR